MRILTILALLCLLTCFPRAIRAQTISRHYADVPMPEALMELNNLQQAYTINFIYDDLEDFRVSTSFRNLSVPDAIRQMIGFYPIQVTETRAGTLFVECTQKTSSRYKGTVVDELGRPLAFASIALLSPRDSTLLAGGVTNESGRFVVPCEASSTLARISHIGYETLYIIMCSQAETATIRMRTRTLSLSGVTVEGQTPIVHREAGTLVFDTRHVAGATHASDLLRQAPGVLLTDGDVTLFGTGGICICINGREQCLGQEELLQMLKTVPASDVERIEMSQTPGARHAAVGQTGMVNIVLRQHGNDYVGGTLGYAHAQSEEYGDEATASMTYSKGKVSTSLNLAATRDHTRHLATNDVQFAEVLRQSTDKERIGKENYSLRWQLDYAITARTDCGAYVMYADGDRNLCVDGAYVFEPAVPFSSNTFTTQTSRVEETKTWAVNINASQKLNDKGAKIDCNLDYYSMSMGDKCHSLGDYGYAVQPQGNDTVEFDYRNHITLHVDNYSAKADISWAGVRLGVQYAYVRSHRDLHYTGVGTYPCVANIYDEQLLTGYAEYAGKLGRHWTARIGGRYEHLWTEITNQPSANADRASYGRLFPSLHVVFRPQPSHDFTCSLGSRITRPNIVNINSDWVWRDVSHVSFGNQKLKPSCLYRATMGYTYGGVLGFDLYYACEPDRIDAVYMVDRQVTYNSWDNASEAYDFGINAFFYLDKLSWMQAMLTQHVACLKTVMKQERSVFGVARRSMCSQVTAIACTGAVQVSLFLDARRKWTAHLNATYSSAEKDVVRRLHARYAVDAGMQARFWKDRLTVGMTCRNLLASRIRGTEYLGMEAMDFDNKINYRQLCLTLTCNWGARLRHSQQKHESDKMQERIVNDF